MFGLGLCKVNSYLAISALVYIVACAFYLIRTRFIGTPFLDSLTDEQKKIRAESGRERRTIFMQGLGVGLLIAIFGNPFTAC